MVPPCGKERHADSGQNPVRLPYAGLPQFYRFGRIPKFFVLTHITISQYLSPDSRHWRRFPTHLEKGILLAIVGCDGRVSETQYLSGPSKLFRVASNAVAQRPYQQTILNNAPAEVETAVTVVFGSDNFSSHQ
jgi:hypothetical protein